MITIQITEEDLLDMLITRLKYWQDNEDILDLYTNYLEDLIYTSCFDDTELDINSYIDNLYINYSVVVNKKDLVEYSNTELVASNPEKDLYLLVY